LADESPDCFNHPGRLAVAWVPIETDSTDEHAKQHLCTECMSDSPVEAGLLGGDEIGTITVISRGAPCKCGPGFCATSRGLAFYGFCKGASDDIAAGTEECPYCEAPHQGTEGCWLCSTKDGAPSDGNGPWLRLLEAGIEAGAAFAIQRTSGLDFGDAVALAVETLPRQHPPQGDPNAR